MIDVTKKVVFRIESGHGRTRSLVHRVPPRDVWDPASAAHGVRHHDLVTDVQAEEVRPALQEVLPVSERLNERQVEALRILAEQSDAIAGPRLGYLLTERGFPTRSHGGQNTAEALVRRGLVEWIPKMGVQQPSSDYRINDAGLRQIGREPT